MSIRIGVLLRHEDESGVSGEGIVADVIEFPDGLCIAHWRSATPSTLIFPNVKQLVSVHGHGGKTEAVFFAELPSPKSEEELADAVQRFVASEEDSPEKERILDSLADELEERLSERMSEQRERDPSETGEK